MSILPLVVEVGFRFNLLKWTLMDASVGKDVSMRIFLSCERHFRSLNFVFPSLDCFVGSAR